ncbi:hypothetical protein K3148_12930 [Qipengyuania aurantiaca]|uniref:Uncharacterized protein n=1 Tax=Qipengyuania aurantiaca TaxID=2867233 RepID=A0ABX8ZR83_9SPHN|nr:hypothetical protein [Qipengyuania aurantiaca]QZD89688.1 hypothetical protein K3148_12930 [Qipengyuania aurantiaca]
MSKVSRVGGLDIAQLISEHIGSYVDMDFIQFVAVEGDLIDLWYMNSGGEGPTFHIQIERVNERWELELKELPPGTEQNIEVP